VASGGAVLALTLLRFGFDRDLTLPRNPHPRPLPRIAEAAQVAQEVPRNPAAYAGYLTMDAAEYGIAPTTPEMIAKVFRYRVDETEHVLEPGGERAMIEAAGLRLSVAVQEERRHAHGLLIMQIENLGDTAVAYRVETVPSHGTQVCQQKRALPHNAMALAAADIETRSECVHREGWTLQVKRVEIVELPELSYHYVSRLMPVQLGIERRTAEGHKPPRGRTCRLIMTAQIARAIERGDTTWRDLVDFYARHRCDTYAFPPGYKAFQVDGEQLLPAGSPTR
jgi:hypothetical protein